MTKQEEKIVNLASKKGANDADLVLLDQLQELEAKVASLEEKLIKETTKEINFPETIFPDVQKVKIQGAEVITIKGEKGDQGEKGDRGDAGADGIGINGKDGMPGEQGARGEKGEKGDRGDAGLQGENGKDGSPDSAMQIRDKLETLKGDERLDSKFVKGLQEEIDALKITISKIPRGGSRGKVPIVRAINLTSDVNGSRTAFALPRDTVRVLGVFGTQFPINFNADVDWTFAGQTLTLVTAQVGTPQSGQTLWCLVETLFYA